MAVIQERISAKGKTSYRVLVRLKGHHAQSATFDRKTDAKKWAQDTESSIRDGRYFKTTEGKKHTLGELVDRYIENELPKKSKITQKKQPVQLLWWKEQIGERLLADVTPALIAEHRDKLYKTPKKNSSQRSHASVNRYLAAISHALTVAVNEWGWLEESPMRKVKKLKEPQGRLRFLSDDERIQLLKECMKSTNKFLYTVVVLALATGARKMEIMNLKWADIDFKNGMIRLEETKNDERRIIHISGHAFDILKGLHKIRRIDTNLLFPGRNPKTPIELRKPWEGALERAKIEDFRFHDLRHSAASYLAMNGATDIQIAEVLGHKTLQMVKRYSHLSKQHTASVVASMNEIIFKDA